MGAKAGLNWRSRMLAGFRAVRMRGKTEVVYCVERKGKIDSCCTTSGKEVDVYAADGSKVTLTSKEFSATHVLEHAPMPPAVKAMFEGKPSFAEWWDTIGKN